MDDSTEPQKANARTEAAEEQGIGDGGARLERTRRESLGDFLRNSHRNRGAGVGDTEEPSSPQTKTTDGAKRIVCVMGRPDDLSDEAIARFANEFYEALMATVEHPAQGKTEVGDGPSSVK